MLQYYRIMRANGPHTLIKSSSLHHCNHERTRVLGHVPMAPQKIGDTDQNFWYYNTEYILNSFHNNLILRLVENMTSLVYEEEKKVDKKITYNLVFRFLQKKLLISTIQAMIIIK